MKGGWGGYGFGGGLSSLVRGKWIERWIIRQRKKIPASSLVRGKWIERQAVLFSAVLPLSSLVRGKWIESGKLTVLGKRTEGLPS